MSVFRWIDKVSGFEHPVPFKYIPIVPVIKIYGIYTHTQLNRIWDAMGQHLAGKGKEYRRRSDLFSSRYERWLTFSLFATVAFSEIVLYMPVVMSIFRRASRRRVSKMTPNRPLLSSPTKTWARCVCTFIFSGRDLHIPTVTFLARVRNFYIYIPCQPV